MYYYWLVPILILAIIAIAIFVYSGRKKAATQIEPQSESPDPIKRGEHLND